MTVQVLVGRGVLETNDRAVNEILERMRPPVLIVLAVVRNMLDLPEVVAVAMRVQRDLLLCGLCQ